MRQGVLKTLTDGQKEKEREQLQREVGHPCNVHHLCILAQQPALRQALAQSQVRLTSLLRALAQPDIMPRCQVLCPGFG